MRKFLTYLRHNTQLTFGLLIIGGMLLLWIIGYFAVDTTKAAPLSAGVDLQPSAQYPLGTDSAGREMLPVLIKGMPMTLEIGLIAGAVGLVVGTILGFTAGYFGGIVDSVI